MDFLGTCRVAVLPCLITLIWACKPTDFSGSSGKRGPLTTGQGGDSDGKSPSSGKPGTDKTLGNQGESEDLSKIDVGGDGDNNSKKPNGELETDSGEKKKCVDETLKTKVKLLTLTVANGVPGNEISYEISVVDCNGDSKPVSGKFVLFDIDAEVETVSANTYLAKVGLQSTSGTLDPVEGVDLFGKTGPDYFHHKTDKTISLTQTTSAVILTIDLHGESFMLMNGNADGTFLVNTHLKFGDADPVTQPVLFVE